MLAGPSAGFGAADTGLPAGRCLGAQLTVDRVGSGNPAQLGVAFLPHQGHHHQRGGHGRVLACQVADVALGGFGRDHSPSPVFGVIDGGISSGVQVTFAELSEGFRTMPSTPVNTQTLSLHLWKALKITLLILAGIHTALGLQDISRSEYTTPLSSKWGFHSVKLLALSCIVAKAVGFFLPLQALRTAPETSLPPMALLSLQVSLTSIHTTWTASSPS